MTVLDETNVSIEAAIRDKTIDPQIAAGPIAALRTLAARIDEDRPTDNVSLPTYLRTCAELRLTPASREALKKEEGGGSKLAKLRSVQGGKPA